MQRLGDYTLGEELGSGHAAVVHAATGPRGACMVKVLRPDASEHLVREAELLARIAHPGVASVFEIADGYIAMELLRGETLAQRLARGPLPEATAIELARAVAEAIRAAHAEGIVHRDLTPSNIFLEDAGPKLVGFGGKGPDIGAPAYLAPEQAGGGEPDERSDIYALGCILFEMLDGRPPFVGEPAEILARKLRDPAPRVSASPELAELVAAMLAPRPGDRPASMADVLAALGGQQPTRFDVVSAWILLALPVLLLLYAILVARHTSEDRPVKPPVEAPSP